MSTVNARITNTIEMAELVPKGPFYGIDSHRMDGVGQNFHVPAGDAAVRARVACPARLRSSHALCGGVQAEGDAPGELQCRARQEHGLRRLAPPERLEQQVLQVGLGRGAVRLPHQLSNDENTI